MASRRGLGHTSIPRRGWMVAIPFNSQPPPAPVGFRHDAWHTGVWLVNPFYHFGTEDLDEETWLPHPAWHAGNPPAEPPVADITRMPWFWAPKGVDISDLRGYPASWSGCFQNLRTQDPRPAPTDSPPRVRALERVNHGRDTPYPNPRLLPPADDAGRPSPDYGPFRVNASPRVAGAPSLRHAREPSGSDTSSPEPSPMIPPPGNPSSTSSYHHRPPPANPSGPSSRAHTHHHKAISPYRGLPPPRKPLLARPEHPFRFPAQSPLRGANRPTAPDAPAALDRRRQ